MVRDATAEDLEDVARVVVAAWAWAFRDILPEEILLPRLDYDRRIANLRGFWPRRGRFLVAEVDGRVVGFANEHPQVGLAGFDAEIGGLYVHPDAAGRGLGAALVREAVRGFLAQGRRSLAIHTLGANRIGRGFYEKIGGRVHAWDDWNGLPAIWYAWDEAAMRGLVR